MPAEVWTLFKRDHDELDHALRVLAECNWPEAELRWALDGMRASFAAHAEAEAAVLRRMLADPRATPALHAAVSHVVAAHVTQEAVLHALGDTRPGTVAWRELVAQLRALMLDHDAQELAYVAPALRDHAPGALCDVLAASYTIARHHMLAMMQVGVPARAAPELNLD